MSIRCFIEYLIRSFPENSRKLSEITEEGSPMIVTPEYLLQLELTVKTINSVYEKLSPDDQELLRMMYWSDQDSAATIDLSRLNRILRELAFKLGYIRELDDAEE